MLKIKAIPDKEGFIKANITYIKLVIKIKREKDSFAFKMMIICSAFFFLLAIILQSIFTLELALTFLIIYLAFNLFYLLKKLKLISNLKKYINNIPSKEFNKEFFIIFEESTITVDKFIFNYEELRCFICYKDYLFIDKKDNTLFNVIFSKKEIGNQLFEEIKKILINKNILELKNKFTD